MSYQLDAERVEKLKEMTKNNKITQTRIVADDLTSCSCISSHKTPEDTYYCRGIEIRGNKFYYTSMYICDVDNELLSLIIENSNRKLYDNFEMLVDAIANNVGVKQ